MDSSDLKKLGEQFIQKALSAYPGERVRIRYSGPDTVPLALACAEAVVKAGAEPVPLDGGSDVMNERLAGASAEEFAAYGKEMLDLAKTIKATITIRDDDDDIKLALSDEERQRLKIAQKPMLQYMMENIRWLVVSGPTIGLAKRCGMNIDQFDQFYRDACLADYGLMAEAVRPLKSLMEGADKVRILSPSQGTDLTLSIKNMPAIPCTGEKTSPMANVLLRPSKSLSMGQSNLSAQFITAPNLAISSCVSRMARLLRRKLIRTNTPQV